MRTLVLGGTGMLGTAISAEWRRRGAAVLALSRPQADLTDADRLAYWARVWNPDLVVNCAAFTAVDDCESREQHALAVNGEAVAHAARAAELADADLVHISSDYVFDGTAAEPYGEESATGPRSAYGRSKLLGERRALAYGRALVLRSSWLFGPGGPNFVLTMRRLMLAENPALRVVDDQVGCPTYTPFLARAVWDLAALRQRGLMHYCNREAVSWHGFARAIADQVRPGIEVRPVPTSEFPRPAPRPPFSVLDISRFEAAVGRRAETWQSGLAAYLDRLGGNAQ